MLFISSSGEILKRCRYFRRLQKRYHDDLALPQSGGEAQENGTQGSSPTAGQSESPAAKRVDDKIVRVPVHCINLLRCNIQVRQPTLLHWRRWVRTS